MGIFKLDDSVLITEGKGRGLTGSIVRCLEDDIYIVRCDGSLFSYNEKEEDLEYYNPMYYAMVEMATVVSTPAVKKDPALRIEVNPDRKRKGNPYFKVLDTEKYQEGRSSVCRLHFLDEEMEYHTGDGLLDWKTNSRDIESIKKLLRKPHKKESQYTNWQMACWLWNLEYGFFVEDDLDNYMYGKFDEENKDHPSYVPSTTEIPDTWEYNPPK